MKIKIETEIETPQLPNFLRTKDGKSFPIALLSEEELRGIGAEWTESLVQLANKRKAINPSEN